MPRWWLRDSRVATYHRIVDVLHFPQSLALVFFAFSTFTFCKHDTWTDVSVPRPLCLTTDTRSSATVTKARMATSSPCAFAGPEMEQGAVRFKPHPYVRGT